MITALWVVAGIRAFLDRALLEPFAWLRSRAQPRQMSSGETRFEYYGPASTSVSSTEGGRGVVRLRVRLRAHPSSFLRRTLRGHLFGAISPPMRSAPNARSESWVG